MIALQSVTQKGLKGKNKSGSANWAAIIFLILIFLIPFWAIMIITTAEPYYPVTGEPLREAAKGAGITVVKVVDSTWPVGGAMGGKTYKLSDAEGSTYTIMTQKFDSAKSRDAAVITFSAQTVGRGKPVGKLIIIGNYLVYVQPFTSKILNQIAPELEKAKAV